jgi:hypothetical protein
LTASPDVTAKSASSRKRKVPVSTTPDPTGEYLDLFRYPASMGNAVLDELRARSPNSVKLSQLPLALLQSSMRTAQEVVEAVNSQKVVAFSGAPDQSVPQTLTAWKASIDKARLRPGTASEPILRLNLPPKPKDRADEKQDTIGYPDEVIVLGESYRLLCHVERLLRERLDEVLRGGNPNYDSDEAFIPSDAQQAALVAMEAEVRAFGEPLSRRTIDYLEFGTIIEMVGKQWKLLEERGFMIDRPRWELIKKDLPILRNAVMHARPIRRQLRAKIVTLHFEILRLLREPATPPR